MMHKLIKQIIVPAFGNEQLAPGRRVCGWRTGNKLCYQPENSPREWSLSGGKVSHDR